MAQKTAVEWLVNKIETKNGSEFSSFYSEFIEQAKQMEKEQIEKAWDDGFDTGYLSPNNANKYYNETYGK